MRTRTSVALALFMSTLVLLASCSGEKPEPEAKTEALKKAKALQTMATPSVDSLPRMIDIGRGKCIPCKKMEPILKELKQTYAGRVVIEIINLDEEPHAGDMYNLKLIPTQIFFDAAGTEVWRHEGFLPRDAIIARFEEMGVSLTDVETRGEDTPDIGISGTEPARAEPSGD